MSSTRKLDAFFAFSERKLHTHVDRDYSFDFKGEEISDNDAQRLVDDLTNYKHQNQLNLDLRNCGLSALAVSKITHWVHSQDAAKNATVELDDTVIRKGFSK
jgi:hypothetical protein